MEMVGGHGHGGWVGDSGGCISITVAWAYEFSVCLIQRRIMMRTTTAPILSTRKKIIAMI